MIHIDIMGQVIRFPVRGRFGAPARVNAIFEPQEAVRASERYDAVVSAVTAMGALGVVAVLHFWG